MLQERSERCQREEEEDTLPPAKYLFRSIEKNYTVPPYEASQLLIKI